MFSEQQKKSKQHVAALFTELAKNDRGHSALAQTLEKDISTGFKGDQKFIYELLQNADDSHDPAKPDLAIKVRFTVITVSNAISYLVFSHNGQHFTNTDVEKICDNAQQRYADKSADSGKIGYKGIGFKAVFSVSECVAISSGGYQFRFDKYYSAWRSNIPGTIYPWQIIPIWTDDQELPTQVKPYLNSQDVNFIIAIKPEISIIKELKIILDKPEIMLFLRHVHCIEIVLDGKKITLELKLAPDGSQVLYKNQEFINAWLKHDLTIDIPLKLQQLLADMTDYERPQRLKNAKKTSLTFAACLDKDSRIIKLQASPLYCYLPTRVFPLLPFLINGDFLLTPERTQLQDNAWNAFLFGQIANLQFSWLAKLTEKEQIRYQVLKLLALPSSVADRKSCAKAFQEGFDAGIKNTAFIPAYKKTILLNAQEAVIDETDFFRQVDVPIPAGLVDFQLESMEVLHKLAGIKQYTPEAICQKIIPRYADKNKLVDFQKKILAFIQTKVYQEHKAPQEFWRQLLKNSKFLLTQKNQIVSPDLSYFPTNEVIDFLPGIEISFVHAELVKISNIKKCLEILGVKESSLIELIRGYVFNLIEEKKISKDNIIAITQFIFKAFELGQLQQRDWQVLHQLPVLTKKNALIESRYAYLANEYQPILMLESVNFHEDIFISSQYLLSEAKTANALEWNALWKEFFVKMGVHADIHFYIRDSYEISQAERDKGVIMSSYLDLLKNKSMTAGTIHPTHHIENFLDCNVIQHLQHVAFASMFWRKAIASWHIFKEHPACRYRLNNGHTKNITISYLAYVVQHTPCVLGTDNKMHNTSEVYLPNFLELRDFLVVADLDVELTDEQANFFGFKSQLLLTDCIKLLTTFNDRKNVDIGKYAIIMQGLLRLNLSATDKKTLHSLASKIKLPAQDGSLQLIANLRCLAIKNITAPVSSAHWLREFPGLTQENLIKIADMFGIKIIDEHDLQFNPLQPRELNDIKDIFLEKLNVIARVEAHAKGVQEKTILQNLYSKLSAITFFTAERLTYSYVGDGTGGTQIFAHLNRKNQLYFKGYWDNPRTIDHFCLELARYFDLSVVTARLLRQILVEKNLQEWLIDHNYPATNLLSVSDLIATTTMSSSMHSSVSHINSKAEMSPEDLADELAKKSTISASLHEQISGQGQDFIPGSNILDTSFTELPPTPPQSKTRSSTTLPATTPPLQRTISFAEFNQEVLPTQIDMRAVSFKSASSTSAKPLLDSKISQHFLSSPSSKNVDTASPAFFGTPLRQSTRSTDNASEFSGAAKKAIGDWGELFVYEKLKSYYCEKYSEKNPNKKYSNTKLTETPTGFTLFAQDEKGNKINLEVVWKNKQGESYAPCDFIINKNGVERIVEVKTTPSSNKSEINVSENEIHIMHMYKERYRFFRVYDAGKVTARIEKVKNPSEKINKNELAVVGMTLNL